MAEGGAVAVVGDLGVYPVRPLNGEDDIRPERRVAVANHLNLNLPYIGVISVGGRFDVEQQDLSRVPLEEGGVEGAVTLVLEDPLSCVVVVNLDD